MSVEGLHAAGWRLTGMLYTSRWVCPDCSAKELLGEDMPAVRRCEKCGSAMAHYRLYGYRCPHGCPA